MGTTESVGHDDGSRVDTTEFRRARASTRSADQALYVSAVGFQSTIHRLEGAAALVWDALADNAALPSLASRLGVAPDDDYLVRAVDMLVRCGLVETTHR